MYFIEFIYINELIHVIKCNIKFTVNRLVVGFHKTAGIYIMQNTMVRGGGGKGQPGKKNEKGERKKEENYI